MPPTILTEDPDIAVAAVRSYGQAVAKPLFTSKARGMKIISAALPNIKDKILEFKSLGNNVLYIQKMIPIPGRDLGVVFLKGNYVGTYARVSNDKSWNTTTVNGGSYQHRNRTPGLSMSPSARRICLDWILPVSMLWKRIRVRWFSRCRHWEDSGACRKLAALIWHL